jgi:chemotaxis methyl-accepting protein methylase
MKYGVCTKEESDSLDLLLTPVKKDLFQSALRRLHAQFDVFARTCPAPFPAPRLIVTQEIRTQCELYLPIAEIAAVFNRLYSAALKYPPVLSSTPFHKALSWADSFVALPTQFQLSANPARLLESLLADNSLLTRFLFASFLPDRFYSSSVRYPAQRDFIKEWLVSRKNGRVRCLDAACGTGEESYGLAWLLLKEGLSPEQICIDGWTLEPLEVWVATHRCLPHDRQREALFRKASADLFKKGLNPYICFNCVDLTQINPCHALLKRDAVGGSQFDLILCNGLLGGPIIQNGEQLELTVHNLSQLLAPGGILLAADNFHGGWKQKCPQSKLRALFEAEGLQYIEPGEGVGGLKPD